MANVEDYLIWRGDVPLEVSPLNEVDGLILSLLSWLNWEGRIPAPLGKAAASMAREQTDEKRASLLRLLGRSRRFARMELEHFEERFSEPEELQFAALTVLTGDGSAMAVFRGTDSSLAGWKENFNLSFSEEVPAQREAARYLVQAAKRTGLPVRTAGHSKGGNLALYASAKTGTAVESAWSYDGPGLSPAMLASEGWKAVADRTCTWIPQSSLVGILLEQPDQLVVIRSDGRGIRQHDPFTWRVQGNSFEKAERLDGVSMYADRTADRWLRSMSPDQKRRLTEAVYRLVQSTGAQTVEELADGWRSGGPAVLAALADLDLHTRLNLYLSVGKLLRSALQGFDNG